MGKGKGGSVLGLVSGKVGDKIFYVRKGKQYVKQYGASKITTRTLLRRKSYRAVNTRVFFAASREIYKKLKVLINPVWEGIVKTKKTPTLSGLNMFMKYNHLQQMIPDKNKLCALGNSPDLTKLVVSYGIVEPTFNLKTVLENNLPTEQAGEIRVEWDPKSYSSGLPDDEAFFVALQWYLRPKGDDKWRESWKAISVCGNLRAPGAKREDGSLRILWEPEYTDEKNPIYGYLFFKDKKGNYSKSNAIIINL